MISKRASRQLGGFVSDSSSKKACEFCDPPDELRQKLGSAIGIYRYAHYLTFPTEESLTLHLRALAGQLSGTEKSYDHDRWLAGVLMEYRQRRAWQAQDERRDLYRGGNPNSDRERAQRAAKPENGHEPENGVWDNETTEHHHKGE